MEHLLPSEQTGLNSSQIVLIAEQITKRFPGILALDRVDFTVYHGAVNVLVGENGAGKSTLMKILAGVEQPTSGRLLLNGTPVEFRSTREAAHAGIGIIYQELNLFPNLSIAENIFVARELTKRGVVQHGEQEKATRRLLTRLEQSMDPSTLVRDLRMGQQQIVEIAKALAQDVRILIMDEPTSALTAAETEALFRIIADLKAHGVAIVYISHKLEELLTIGDHVTVLRDGKLAAEAPARSVTLPWIIEKMVGRTVRAPRRRSGRTVSGESSASAVGREFTRAASAAAQMNLRPTATPEPAGEPVLSVKNLSLPRVGAGYTLENVSFALGRGEILALYGLMGAGRTELFECLMGLHPEATGEIRLAGRVIRHESIAERIDLGLMLVPEDRQRLGLVQQLSVAHNISLASLNRFLTSFWLSETRELKGITALMRELAIKARTPAHPVTSLSGGNQQKVVVAKSLLTRPQVLLLDEPTRGIDVGAKAEIFEIVNRLADQGLGILFVSSELTEVLAVPDRILVLSKGNITGEFNHDQATEELLVTASAARQQTEHAALAARSADFSPSGTG
jgi:erythritol transport system ATP-binding protein